MGSMGHDNESGFVEHWVNDGRGAVLRRFSRSLWERLTAKPEVELPAERKKAVQVNKRHMTFDAELWAEAEAEAAWTSE